MTELEQTRTQLALLEKQYLMLCDAVRVNAQYIYDQAANANAQKAADLAAELVQRVMAAKQQYLMYQEQASGYNLTALSVDVAVPSNSETGWERKE